MECKGSLNVGADADVRNEVPPDRLQVVLCGDSLVPAASGEAR